jgi:hypothetical protein
LLRLLRAMDPRALDRNAERVDALHASTSALRRELRAMRDGLTGLTTQLVGAQVQLDRLAELQREDVDAAARLDALAHVLDVNLTGTHVRKAVARATLVEGPVPHALITGLFPEDVYRAVIQAIPSSLFFEDGGRHGLELRVPPTLAPTYAVATWTFLADVVSTVLGPALAERFQGPVERYVRARCPPVPRETGIVISIGPGRVVQTGPSGQVPVARARAGDVLSGTVYLARDEDGESDGNSALVMLDPVGVHDQPSIPPTALAAAATASTATTTRYTYVFRMSVDGETRRRLVGETSA